MPGLFYEPISRRRFWTVSGGLAAGSIACRYVAGGQPDTEWRVALLSDTHIPADPTEKYRGFAPVENLRQVAQQVVQARPAAALLCGDAARLEGKVGDYQALRTLLEPIAETAPVVIGLGNHDDRRNFVNVFPSDATPGKQPVPGKHVVVLEHPLARVVMLDSLLYVNKVAGLLGKAQRAWLTAQLPKLSDRPLVLFVHHTLGDGDGDLLDVDRLMRIVSGHKHVKAIFYGHSHTLAFGRRDQVQLINLPACGYNFSDAQPVGWMDAQFHRQGVKLTLRAIGGNRRDDGRTFAIEWA